MYNRAIINFDRETLDRIHAHSLELLRDTGIRFPCPEALDLFRQHGLKVDGEVVYFESTHIALALKSVPPAFTVAARNPANDIRIGENHYVMAPGYGPPFIIDINGRKRDATLADAATFCKLVQSSRHLDFNSSIVVQPNDVDQKTAHLDVLLNTITLTDKPLMGSSASAQAACDSLHLADMIFDQPKRPVMISLINSLSPLQYAAEMIEALMVFARAGQPVIIHSSCTLGSTGPITIAGSLVISNATTLAGICLSQLVNPGTPVIYGLGGSPTDMKSGGYVNASPEDVKYIAISSAMGRYYNLPCRGQGALTESFGLDYQAGMESAMMLTAAALSGINVGLHTCGTLGSMLAMSFEKFLFDEDLCGAVKRLIKPVSFGTDDFALDLVKRVGHNSSYLLKAHTFERCRDEFHIPDLMIRTVYDKWYEMTPRELHLKAATRLQERLDAYQKPDLEPDLVRDLKAYMSDRKNR